MEISLLLIKVLVLGSVNVCFGLYVCPVPPSCPADTNGSGSASETVVLSFDVPYSEGAGAHRKGRECQDCRRIRKDDRDSPVRSLEI